MGFDVRCFAVKESRNYGAPARDGAGRGRGGFRGGRTGPRREFGEGNANGVEGGYGGGVLEIVASCGERKVMERLWKEAVDHVSLTVGVAAAVAILMARLVMSLLGPLAGPMSATVPQVEDMK